MRNSAFLAIGLFLLAAPAAQAVQLKDCSQGTTAERITCLQDNIVLLNSSHEAVAAELRKDIADLKNTVNTLNTQVTTLTGQLTQLKGQIPKLDSVVFAWTTHPSSCITYMGNNLLQVTDTCVDPNKNQFAIRPFHR
jgi:hypothetical protein